MLGLLFVLAGAVLAASWFKPPQALWQKAAARLAALLLVAVLIAWGIEAAMQTPVE